MIYLTNTLIVIGAFLTMEVIAWMLHKYVMHGFLWKVHEDHHVPHDHKFERNDFFALIFGIPSWLFIMFGIMHGLDYKLYIGIGITLYGICYVLIHDGLIHQRIKVFTHTRNVWLVALKLGHESHHHYDPASGIRKKGDLCYGMLWVPKKYVREARKLVADGKTAASVV